MRPSVSRIAVLSCAALAVLPATASAARTSLPATPRVTSVKPLQLRIGDRLTITGTGFIKGKNRNTVVFRRDGKRAVFAKAVSATSTRLVVKVPAKLQPFLASAGAEGLYTRFRIRVLSRRMSNSFTTSKRSPRIGPAVAALASGGGTAGAPAGTAPAPVAAPAVVPPDCDADGAPDAIDLDDDNDQLTDDVEKAIGTNRCLADTDGDGISDAFEYESALDLNTRARPYPGERPYPNPLDGTDGNVDFDGDGLTQAEEYTLWRHSGGVLPLTYSEGDQDTNRNAARTDAAGSLLDRNEDGYLTDDEKDADGDQLSNWEETHGPMLIEWWSAAYSGEGRFEGKPTAARLYETSFIDSDSDGDGLIDGLDDQDHDGWSNVDELYRAATSIGSGLWSQPYNPCLPDPESRACTLHPPFTDSWAPFDNSGGAWGPPFPLAWPRP